MDLVLNNLQRLICHKSQQIKPNLFFFMWNHITVAQLAGAVEYTSCISAEG